MNKFIYTKQKNEEAKNSAAKVKKYKCFKILNNRNNKNHQKKYKVINKKYNEFLKKNPKY